MSPAAAAVAARVAVVPAAQARVAQVRLAQVRVAQARLARPRAVRAPAGRLRAVPEPVASRPLEVALAANRVCLLKQSRARNRAASAPREPIASARQRPSTAGAARI